MMNLAKRAERSRRAVRFLEEQGAATPPLMLRLARVNRDRLATELDDKMAVRRTAFNRKPAA